MGRMGMWVAAQTCSRVLRVTVGSWAPSLAPSGRVAVAETAHKRQAIGAGKVAPDAQFRAGGHNWLGAAHLGNDLVIDPAEVGKALVASDVAQEVVAIDKAIVRGCALVGGQGQVVAEAQGHGHCGRGWRGRRSGARWGAAPAIADSILPPGNMLCPVLCG